MTDPFDLSTELPGGLILRDARGSRMARILARPGGGLFARADDGTEASIPWRDVRLRWGPERKDVYCVAADRSVTIHSAHPDFLRALEAGGGNDINDALSRLLGERVSNTTRHRVGCTLLLALVALAFWGLPRAFRGTIKAAVSAVPFSVDQTIGESVFGEMDVGGDEVDDPVVRDAVQAIIDRLAPARAIQEATFRFKVIENEQINAFALPGGYIVVFTGLLREADRPEEVAGVLAHEISHVTLRHGLRRIAHSLGLWTGIGLVLGNTDSLSSIAVQLFTLSSVNDYSREQESEADIEGARMMIDVGLDPEGLVDFFDRIQEEVGDVPDALSWLSTHPQHRERIEAVRAFEAAHVRPGEERWRPLEIDWEAVRSHLEE